MESLRVKPEKSEDILLCMWRLVCAASLSLHSSPSLTLAFAVSSFSNEVSWKHFMRLDLLIVLRHISKEMNPFCGQQQSVAKFTLKETCARSYYSAIWQLRSLSDNKTTTLVYLCNKVTTSKKQRSICEKTRHSVHVQSHSGVSPSSVYQEAQKSR